MIEALINDSRVISRLTVAINSIVAMQQVDNRSDQPWRYDDVQRMLGICWNLDLQSGEINHQVLVSKVQPEIDPALKELGNMLAERVNDMRKATGESRAAA